MRRLVTSAFAGFLLVLSGVVLTLDKKVVELPVFHRDNFTLSLQLSQRYEKKFQNLPTATFTDKKYYLSVFSIFRNEVTLIREWVAHYIRQGVDHFFLIDHDSDDGTRQSLTEYEIAGYITYFSFHDHSRGAQVRAYNQFWHLVAADSEWALVVDVDEFCHSRRHVMEGSSSRVSTVREVLTRFYSSASFVLLADIYFGNPGYVEQPENVLCHFDRRADYDLSGQPEFVNPTLTRYLIRTSTKDGGDISVNNAPTFSLHNSRRDGRYGDDIANGKQFVPPHDIDRVSLNESEIQSAYLIVNHYRVLSKKWYFSVRATRGNVFVGDEAGKLDNIEAEYEVYNPHYTNVRDTFLASATPYCA